MNFLPPVVTAAPAEEPITVAEARDQCSIGDATDFDTMLTGYIKAAREHVEKYCGIQLVTQTVELKADRFCSHIRLPVAPVQSVTIEYLDTDGAIQTLAADQYELFGAGTLEPFIEPAYNVFFPSTRANKGAVTITAICGYDTVPQPIRQAMLLLIGGMFANREDVNVGNIVNEQPNGVQSLLGNYRRF